MALTPWNRQEEWYQQMINASTGNYLPSITAQDEGKVLTVENDGSWGVENVPSELPAVTASDKDKFLHTNDSTGAVEWADAPDGLPAVTDVDEGKVLTVNNSGVWGAQEPIGKKFIITLTPTAQDFSGTMDKTVAEINAAYEAGMEIVFQIRTEIIGFNVILSSIAGEMLGLDNGGSLSGYLGFHALFVVPQMNVMIHVSTIAGDTGTDNTYSTTLYALTPET